MSIKKYRKKPVVIEAQKYIGSKSRVLDFIPNNCAKWVVVDNNEELYIETLEGNMHVNVGDFIIKGVNGEFYPCKPDIFEKSYEEAE